MIAALTDRSKNVVLIILLSLFVILFMYGTQNTLLSVQYSGGQLNPLTLNASCNGSKTKLIDDKNATVFNGDRFDNCSKRLPDVIIIGAQKCGTGTLLEFLDMHSQIKRTDADEVTFFYKNYKSGPEGKQKHLSAMPCAYKNQLVLEKCPRNFITPKVPQRVWQENKNMKLLLILKNPIQRIISHFMHVKRITKPTPTSNQTLESALLKSNGHIKTESEYITTSKYYIHLQKWFKVFPRDQILILDSEQFIDDPSSVLTQVETFLGLKHEITKDMFKYIPRKGFYCYKKKSKFQCMPKTKGKVPIKISQKLNDTLTEYFYPWNELLKLYANVNFNW